MSCTTPEVKKSEFVSAVNSFAAASRTGDPNLMNMSANLLQSLIEQLSFAPEEAEEVVEEKELQEVAK